MFFLFEYAGSISILRVRNLGHLASAGPFAKRVPNPLTLLILEGMKGQRQQDIILKSAHILCILPHFQLEIEYSRKMESQQPAEEVVLGQQPQDELQATNQNAVVIQTRGPTSVPLFMQHNCRDKLLSQIVFEL